MRRALPREIEVEIFEKECNEKLTKEEKDFLLKYYFQSSNCEGNPVYFLRNILK